jgi:hypothetical protein
MAHPSSESPQYIKIEGDAELSTWQQNCNKYMKGLERQVGILQPFLWTPNVSHAVNLHSGVSRQEISPQPTITVEPGPNNVDLCDISFLTLDILWNQLIPHC